MKIGLFGNEYQIEKQKCIQALFDKLQALHTEIYVERRFYNYLVRQIDAAPAVDGLIESDQLALDLAISLGGDGTFLRTAAWVGRQNIPILGINMGRLGFLADINTDDIEDTLDEIFRREYTVEKRSVLELESAPPFPGTYNYALNEIAILKRDTSSMITIHTSLNEEFLTNYLGDGLLIATPTGSTAYSMSVNGPIIIPEANNFVLSPVAPHSLNVRPLVIPEDYCIRLKVETRNNNFLVALDGRSEIYPSGSEFFIRKADFTIRLVKRYPQNFYETLRKKLLWGADVRVSKQENRILYGSIIKDDMLQTELSETEHPLLAIQPQNAEPKSPVVKENSNNRLLQRLEDLMRTERLFTNPSLTRKILAERLHTNENYLVTAIHNGHNGQTFSDYINSLRLAYAHHLLITEPELSIKEITDASGFPSYKYFHKLFHEEFGMPPSKCKEMTKE